MSVNVSSYRNFIIICDQEIHYRQLLSFFLIITPVIKKNMYYTMFVTYDAVMVIILIGSILYGPNTRK